MNWLSYQWNRIGWRFFESRVPKPFPLNKWVRYGWAEWHYRTSDILAHIHWDRFTKKWRAQSLNCNVNSANFGHRVDASRHDTKQEAMLHCEKLKLEATK